MASTVTIHVTASSHGVAGTFARVAAMAERMGRRIERSVNRATDVAGQAFADMASGAVESFVGILQDARTAGLKLAAIGPPLAGLGVVIAGVIGNLTGLASTLPAALLAGAASLAVFKLGLKGVGDAFEAGISGDVEKFKEALKGLDVHAQDFVRTGVKIVDAWKPLQKVVQGHLFRGAAAAIRDINSVVQPLAEKWLPKIASLFAQAGQGVAKFFKSAGVGDQLDTIMRGVWRNIDGILKSIPFLMQAFLDIGEVGASMFGDVGEGVAGLAEKFANWIRGLKESGELQRWADRAKEAFSTLGRIAENVGRVIMSIFKNGSDEGQTFLENIEKQTQKWAEFMESADGAKLVDSLGTIGAAMGNLVGLIQFLSEVWLGWVAVFEDGIAFINRGWEAMMQMAITAFGAIIDAMVAVFGNFPIIGDLLKKAQSDFNAFKNGATNSMNQVASSTMSAGGAVNSLSGAINSLHSKTIYIDVIERKTMTGTLGGSGGYRGFAHGGIATGVKQINERGPELVDFGAYPAKITPAGTAREMARRDSGGGGGDLNLTVMPGPGAGTMEGMLLEALQYGRIILKLDSSGRVKPA